jgi:hypothetical protein
VNNPFVCPPGHPADGANAARSWCADKRHPFGSCGYHDDPGTGGRGLSHARMRQASPPKLLRAPGVDGRSGNRAIDPRVDFERRDLWCAGRFTSLPTPYYGFESVDYLGFHGNGTFGQYLQWLAREQPTQWPLLSPDHPRIPQRAPSSPGNRHCRRSCTTPRGPRIVP